MAMHGGRRVPIDPRTPTMPGRSKSGISPARQTSRVYSVLEYLDTVIACYVSVTAVP